MTRVAVTHAPLGDGGSERVCFGVLEALQGRYDVTFVTDKPLRFADRNEFFGTAVDPDLVSVRRLPRVVSWLFETFPSRLWRFKQSVVNRVLRRIEDQYDLVVSTMSEYELSGPTVQYVHYPAFSRVGPDVGGQDSPVYAVYDRLSALVAGLSADPTADATVLANSRWTAELVERAYGTTPRVVYPPVSADRFRDVPWTERENGVVSVSRLGPRKRVLELVDAVTELVDRGHDVHHHIVGSTDDPAYADRIRQAAADRDFIHLEGKIPRDELADLLSTHRYGLHGTRNEHFGIAVAEMATAGMIPFAHGTGGQREILEDVPELLYDDRESAVETMTGVLSDPDRQRRLRDRMAAVAPRFDDERFREEIRDAVETALAEG